jgi:hypothetical protein
MPPTIEGYRDLLGLHNTAVNAVTCKYDYPNTDPRAGQRRAVRIAANKRAQLDQILDRLCQGENFSRVL